MTIPTPPNMPANIPTEHAPLAQLILDGAKYHYELAQLRREEDARRDERDDTHRSEQRLISEQLSGVLSSLSEQVNELRASSRENGKAQARLLADFGLLRREFETLRKELAAVHARVTSQTDDVHDLRARIEQIEHDLAELKQELHVRLTERSQADTLTPPAE